MPRSGSSSAVPKPSAGGMAPIAVGPFFPRELLPGRREDAEGEGSGGTRGEGKMGKATWGGKLGEDNMGRVTWGG